MIPIEIADALYANGEFHAAIKQYSRIIEADKSNADASMKAGHFAIGRHCK